MTRAPSHYWQDWRAFRIPLSQWRYLEALFNESKLSKPNRKAFCYFLFSHISRPYTMRPNRAGGPNSWLEGITAAFLEDKFKFGANNRVELKRVGLLRYQGEAFAGVASRKTIQYRIPETVLIAILEAGVGEGEGCEEHILLWERISSRGRRTPLDSDSMSGVPPRARSRLKGSECKIVDHKGGRKSENSPPSPPSLSPQAPPTSSLNPFSPNILLIPPDVQASPESFSLLYGAAQAIQAFKPNFAALRDHLKALKQADSGGGRYRNDAACFQNIQRGGTSFQPRYKLLQTGRFAAIGGCLQSCSREMKRAAYLGLADCHNYDLEASQAFICLEQMKKAGADFRWLNRYLTDSRTLRAQYAQEIGITEAVWKKCFYAVVMGAALPTHLNISQSFGEWNLKDSFVAAFPDDEEKRKLAYKAFRRIVGPLVKGLKQWGKRLEEQYEDANIPNALGITRHYSEFERPTTQIPAHILQGAEALFIHTLTTLGPQYGFTPIANEHDGLVTIGKIPPEAVEEAKRLTGMNYLNLEIKPF